MKTITLQLYTFDELSEEVQKEIIERERWNIMDQCMVKIVKNFFNFFVHISPSYNILIIFTILPIASLIISCLFLSCNS